MLDELDTGPGGEKAPPPILFNRSTRRFFLLKKISKTD